MLTGFQSVLLNEQGHAVGGHITLTAQDFLGTNELFIPEAVSLNLINFNAASPLTVADNVNILGSVYAIHDTAGQESIFNFGSLNIGSSGLLSASLPTIDLFSNFFSSSSLTLNVVNSVLNAGTISSPGVLNINAGASVSNTGLMTGSSVNLNAGSLINNAGAIAALNGAVNLNSAAGQYFNSGSISALNSINVANQAAASLANINFDNTGGVLAAGNSINFRASEFMEKADLEIYGGDFLSNELNLNGGNGVVAFNGEEVTGVVNATGHDIRINSQTADLQLGTLTGTGDPRVSNTGNINITASIIGNPISIYAGGNITDSGGTAKTLDSQGGDMFLAAGVQFTPNPGGDETITGASATGGSIALNDGNLTITTGGGNLLAIAREGTDASSGRVTLMPSGSITTNGGNFTVIAEESSTGVNSIVLRNVDTTGGGAGVGNVNIRAATINQSENVVVSNTGALLNPAGLNAYSAGADRAGSIDINNDVIAEAAQIQIQGGGNIQIEGVINNSTTTANAGNIIVNSSGGTARVDNDAAQAVAVNNSTTSGNGGTIIFDAGGAAGDVDIDGRIDNSSTGTAGTVRLTSANDQVRLDSASSTVRGDIINSTTGGNGGTININAVSLAFLDGRIDNSSTGSGGIVTLDATGGTVQVSNGANNSIGLNNSTTGGNGGTIIINAGGATGDVLIDGEINNSSTLQAGNINIAATGDDVVIAGPSTTDGNIINSTTGGNAGTITITAADDLIVDGVIDNRSTGQAGILSLTGTDGSVTVSNNGNNTTFAINNATTNGNGGTIVLRANGTDEDVTVGGSILNTSTGIGGSITLDSNGDDLTVAKNISGTGWISTNIDNSTTNGPGGIITIESFDAAVIRGDIINTATTTGGTVNVRSTDGSVTLQDLSAAAADINNSTTGATAGTINVTASGAATNHAVYIEGTLDNSSNGTAGAISVSSANSNVTIDNVLAASQTINNTTSNGVGGVINISAGGASGSVRVDGTIDNRSTQNGGTVTLTSANNDVTVAAASSVERGNIINSTTGGDGGNIHAAFNEGADMVYNAVPIKIATLIARGRYSRAAQELEQAVPRGFELRGGLLSDAF